MFGFSFTKLVVLALLIAAVWYGFKWYGRVQKTTKKDTVDAASNTARGVDTEACPVCGMYVPTASATDCGKAGCPYPK